MIKKLLFGLLLAGGLAFAQPAPVKVVDGNSNEVILGAAGVAVDSGLTAVTTGGVTLLSSTTKVQVIHCLNYSVSSATLTITDNAGSPVTYVPAVAMAANSIFVLTYGPVGLSYDTGVKASASANSAIKCRVAGVK